MSEMIKINIDGRDIEVEKGITVLQAAKKAKSYLRSSSFSKTGLIEQLEFEGFTYDQAVYGVKSVGY